MINSPINPAPRESPKPLPVDARELFVNAFLGSGIDNRPVEISFVERINMLSEQAVALSQKIPGVRQDPPFRFKEVHLELTTACNFRCGFCPLTDLHRPPARLDAEIAEMVLRECVEQKL